MKKQQILTSKITILIFTISTMLITLKLFPIDIKADVPRHNNKEVEEKDTWISDEKNNYNNTTEIRDTWISDEYVEYIIEISNKYSVQPELIEAIIERESSGVSTATNKSCKGLMQVNSVIHKKRMISLGVSDIYDPYSNILVGVDLFTEIAEKYDDVAAALMHYHGERNVESKLDRGHLSKYASDILERSHELEMLHYGR